MKLIALSTLAIISFSVEAKLPTEIARLTGKMGTFTSIYNGKSVAAETGTDCKIEENEYGEGSVAIDSVSYFTPTADLEGASKSISKGVVTYVTTYNGKRPGGSVCGDYKPLTSYKQTVIVTKNSLTIKQKFTCALFERNEIIETCTIK